jgi:O-antigen ligase
MATRLVRGLAEPASLGVSRAPALPLFAWVLGLALLGAAVYLGPVASVGLLGLMVVAVPVLWLVWRRPEFGLLAMSVFTAGLVPRTAISVSLAGFRLDAADLTMAGLLAIFVARGLRRKALVLPQWPVSAPLLAFAGYAAFSALYASLYQGVEYGLVLAELRPAVYCAGCMIAASMVARRHQIIILLAGLFVLADLISASVILQQFLGPDNQLVAGMSDGTWQMNSQIDQVGGAGAGFGAVRIVPPGHILMYLMVNIAFGVMLGPLRSKWLRGLLALELVYISVGLLLTYTRAQWIASGIALLLICAFLPWAAKKRLGRLLFVVSPLLVLSFGLTEAGVVSLPNAEFGEALVSRASSILTADETLGSASLEWRRFEVEVASQVVAEHPVFGVGLGNDYRAPTLFQGEAAGWLWELDGPARLTRFVHNSYFYMAVKMGLPAIALFLWFSVALLFTGALAYHRASAYPAKIILLVVVSSLPGILEWATFQAHFMQSGSMTTLGLMAGMVAGLGQAHDALMDADGEPNPARPSASVR